MKMDALLILRKKEIINVDNLLQEKWKKYNLIQVGCNEIGCNDDTYENSNRTYHSSEILNDKLTSDSGKHDAREDCVVKKYKLTDCHLKDERYSRVLIGKNRMLKIELFEEFPWATFHHQTKEKDTGGWLQYGICGRAKEFNGNTWREGGESNQDVWINGTKDWDNFDQAQKLRLHANPDTHKKSMGFLFARDNYHILTDLDKQGNGELEGRQIQNR